MSVFTILRFAVWTVLRIVELLLLFRALLSFIPLSDRLYDVFYMLTEPMISPIRRLADRLGLNPMLPIDIPFFITFLLVSLLETVVM